MKALASNVDEDLALELGGKLVRNDGSVFNAGGRAGVRRLPTPSPVQAAPAPEPVTPAQLDNTALVQALMQMVGKLQPQTPPAPQVHVAAPQVTVQPLPRCSWTFEFQRNLDGSIKSITAHPQE